MYLRSSRGGHPSGHPTGTPKTDCQNKKPWALTALPHYPWPITAPQLYLWAMTNLWGLRQVWGSGEAREGLSETLAGSPSSQVEGATEARDGGALLCQPTDAWGQIPKDPVHN